MSQDHPKHGTEKDPGLMRSLGQFVGHIVKGVKTPADADKTEVSRRVEQEETTDDQGRKVTLRRTTIEEIEMEPDRGDG